MTSHRCRCGYDLRSHAVGDRCPECGRTPGPKKRPGEVEFLPVLVGVGFVYVLAIGVVVYFVVVALIL